MWRPLSKILEAIGRARIPIGPPKSEAFIGKANAVDALGGFDWQQYRTAEALHAVWGPLPDTPWEPYHCVPLFAALDTVREDRRWPTAPESAGSIEVPPHLSGAALAEPLGGPWAEAGVWVIFDLPGIQSVTLAPRFVATGYQPVCTFDHWPHPMGLLHPEGILAQLLRLAPVVARLRDRMLPTSPPLWICDRERLGTRRGNPHEFDNRYFLDDSLLPGPEALRKAGIQHIVCVVPDRLMNPLEDLHAYFSALRKEGFNDIHGAALSDPTMQTFEFGPMPVTSRFSDRDFQRSASGGFGRLIPEESSSSG